MKTSRRSASPKSHSEIMAMIEARNNKKPKAPNLDYLNQVEEPETDIFNMKCDQTNENIQNANFKSQSINL